MNRKGKMGWLITPIGLALVLVNIGSSFQHSFFANPGEIRPWIASFQAGLMAWMIVAIGFALLVKQIIRRATALVVTATPREKIIADAIVKEVAKTIMRSAAKRKDRIGDLARIVKRATAQPRT